MNTSKVSSSDSQTIVRTHENTSDISDQPPKTECGCLGGRGIENGHIRKSSPEKQVYYLHTKRKAGEEAGEEEEEEEKVCRIPLTGQRTCRTRVLPGAHVKDLQTRGKI